MHLTFKCPVREEEGQKDTEEWLKIIFMTYELLRLLHETGGERKEKREVGVEMDMDAFIS